MEPPLVNAVESFETEQQTVEQIRGCRDRIFAELSKVIIGQREVAEELLLCLFANGHCLITGHRAWRKHCWCVRSRRFFT